MDIISFFDKLLSFVVATIITGMAKDGGKRRELYKQENPYITKYVRSQKKQLTKENRIVTSEHKRRIS